MMGGTVLAPFPDTFWYGWDEETTNAFCLRELYHLLRTVSTPMETAAMLVEPVQGESGYVPANAGFLQGVAERCREHGIFSVQNENVTVDKPMSQCAKWNEPFVLVSGHLQPCCCINMANDRPHQERSSFVNMFFEDFKSWWNSKEKLQCARDLKDDDLSRSYKTTVDPRLNYEQSLELAMLIVRKQTGGG